MRINHYEGESDLAALVDRLYRFPRPSKAGRARAEAALLECNPHLRDLGRVALGTTIVVPDIPDAEATQECSVLGKLLGLVRTEELRDLTRMQEAVERRIDRQVEEARAVLEAAKRPDLVKLARKDAAFRKYRSEVTKKAKATIANAEAVKAARRAGFEELRARLDRRTGGESAAQR